MAIQEYAKRSAIILEGKKLYDLALYKRAQVFNPNTNQFLLSKLSDSMQSKDLSVPPNCGGYGRVHHFFRNIDPKWVNDPLPIDPASKALGLPYQEMIETQVFQLAVCNAHCWYCFVPDELKCAELKNSKWFTAEEMINAFLNENNKIKVIDLSGGNPELVPEWIVYTMKSLDRLGLSDKIYLWSDDTLTTDFTHRFLSKDDLNYFKSYKNYGKVCCFKGYDSNSFSFNSGLPSAAFFKQFELFKRYLDIGIDLYGYVTFTSEDYNDIEDKMCRFVDTLQEIKSLLPLRIVPLEILPFSPTKVRITDKQKKAIEMQFLAINEWKKQLNLRYTKEQLTTRISDINLL